MICPKCNSNNPKDPLQCIRCGYIFPEYIAKHEIDMTRGSKNHKQEQKQVEAIKNYTPKSVTTQNRTSTTSSQVTYQRPTHHDQIASEKIHIPEAPPAKLKMEKLIGRNGINRTDDIKECLKVFYIALAVIALVSIVIYGSLNM